jgi:uncharacterized membrane protein YphA (DoxX/SURF4 family)
MMRQGVESAWWVLRIGLGLGPALAGLDKIFRANLLADWPSYISPIATAVLPISGDVFMQIVGVIELAVGVAILTFATRIGAWIAMAWLLLIAANLVTMGHFDIAVRDVEMALAAYALARITAEREAATARPASRSVSVTGHAVA